MAFSELSELSIHRMQSPNRDECLIPVDYLVLHYTAVDLQGTLDIFMDPQFGVSSHLVIDTDGSVYELVNCLNGEVMRGWHAGVSRWQGREGFNDFSIGIELVNYNGNLFPFSEAQYAALRQVVCQLKTHYPALAKPDRVVGHEQIAGFRGKADPGLCFDWPRFYRENYPESPAPKRLAVCPDELQKTLLLLKDSEPEGLEEKSRFWRSVSALTETSVGLIQQASKPQ